jgi:nucleoside-diphosphate-sugar epimerase
MKVLITGCAGFIGSHLAEQFLSKGHTVIGIDNFDPFYGKEQKLKNLETARSHKNFIFHELDIRNGPDLSVLPKDMEFVVHLAAKAGIHPSIESPQDYVDTNITGTLNILEWMKNYKIKKMIFGSSSSIYGNNRKTPFSESDPVDKPISPYAFTKKACELMNHTYHHLYKMDILNLRFFTVYGPRQRPDLAIRKFVEHILYNKPIHLFGDGSSARDYTFVQDTVSGIFNAFTYMISKNGIYDIINLGNSKPIKLIELVNCIYEVLGKQPNLVFEPMQPGDVDITYADISKAKKLLNYHPVTDLKIGITKFIEWHKEAIK